METFQDGDSYIDVLTYYLEPEHKLSPASEGFSVSS